LLKKRKKGWDGKELDESKYMADMPALGAGISPVSYVNLIPCKLFLIYIYKNKVVESIIF
jgi:hypothetical protein